MQKHKATDEAVSEEMKEMVKDHECLDQVIGVQEAAVLWGYENPDSVKHLCAKGKVKAKKIGKTWVIDKNQPSPKKN